MASPTCAAGSAASGERGRDLPPRKPAANRVQRTPEVQRERDRKIPRPPAESGLRVAAPNDWVAIWHEVAAKPPVKVTGYVLLKFADYWDGADIRPGEDRLADITQQTTRTIRSVLGQMREWGLIWRYRQGSKHGRQQLADEYRLTLPDDLVTRVPLIAGVAALSDHRNMVPVFNPEHRNDVPVIGTDQTDHRNLMHGSPESDDTDHRNDVPPTVISDLSTTSSSIGVPTPLADVEGNTPGAVDEKAIDPGREENPEPATASASGDRRCQYSMCRTPQLSIEAGKDYHPNCESFARVKAKRRQVAVTAEQQPPAGRSPYPDDHRDELPEDYEDGDHAA